MKSTIMATLAATFKQLWSNETAGPLDSYPHPKENFKSKKHNHFSPALKHQNKTRYIRSRVLSRQYK